MKVVDLTTRPCATLADKAQLRMAISRHDALTGFIPVQGATAEMARNASAEAVRRAGLDPETSTTASRAVVGMREE